jgi:hypothetical protein
MGYEASKIGGLFVVISPDLGRIEKEGDAI